MYESRINNINQKTEEATLWPYGKCRRCANKNYCIWNKDEIINCISNEYPNFCEMTNADRIRAMSNRELAKAFHDASCNWYSEDYWLEWLEQKVEKDE